jgi:hypothetical protein
MAPGGEDRRAPYSRSLQDMRPVAKQKERADVGVVIKYVQRGTFVALADFKA